MRAAEFRISFGGTRTGQRPQIRNCIYFHTLTPTIRAAQTDVYDRFLGLDSGRFSFGRTIYAEDNSSFDSLDFRKEQNARQTVPLNIRTLRPDSSAVLDSSAFHLDREI
jgi:hypothetical protein